MYHSFANLFYKLSESTFYKEMSNFSKKFRVKNICLHVAVMQGIALFLFSRQTLTTQLSSGLTAFWGKVHSFTIPGPKVIKLFFMLNSFERGILSAHKYKNIKKFNFF